MSQEEENENEKIHHHDCGNEIRAHNENATLENDITILKWGMCDDPFWQNTSLTYIFIYVE